MMSGQALLPESPQASLQLLCAFMLGNGIAVPVIAAPPSIESSMTPITSTVTDAAQKGKAPAGPTASNAAVTVGFYRPARQPV